MKLFSGSSAAQQIYTQKLEYRPLSTNPVDDIDARESRRRKRVPNRKHNRKPKPLSAKEKKELRIFDSQNAGVKLVSFQYRPNYNRYENFLVLNRLWNAYISEILLNSSLALNTAVNGPILLKADYHGSFMMVEDCRCESRKGISGICVKETKNMFEIITNKDRLVKIPKEKSMFRISAKPNTEHCDEDVEWRLWGDQFLLRSGERAGRKFSGKTIRGKPLLEL